MALVPCSHSRRRCSHQQLLRDDLAFRADGLARNANPSTLHNFRPASQQACARARQSVVAERIRSAATAVCSCAAANVWREGQGQAESSRQGNLHVRRREHQARLRGGSAESQAAACGPAWERSKAGRLGAREGSSTQSR